MIRIKDKSAQGMFMIKGNYYILDSLTYLFISKLNTIEIEVISLKT